MHLLLHSPVVPMLIPLQPLFAEAEVLGWAQARVGGSLAGCFGTLASDRCSSLLSLQPFGTCVDLCILLAKVWLLHRAEVLRGCGARPANLNRL